MDNVVVLVEHPADHQFITEEIKKVGKTVDWGFPSTTKSRDIKDDILYGRNIPLRLACEAREVWEICYKETPPTGNYTVEDMRAAGATIQRFYVFNDKQADSICKKMANNFKTLYLPLNINDEKLISPSERWKKYLFE